MAMKAPPNQDLRMTLFADGSIQDWPPSGEPEDLFPWNLFVKARTFIARGDVDSAKKCWRTVVGLPNLESRHCVQAWNFLRLHGEPVPPETRKQLLGVVVELGFSAGLGILAAYADYSAQYHNFSGGGLVWDRPNTSLDRDVGRLLAASLDLLNQIEVWEGTRPGPPPSGMVRLSFLTPGGLHFREGLMADMSRDALRGPILRSATALIQGFISLAKKGV